MYAIFQLLLISFGCLTVFAQVNERTYTLKVTKDVTLERGSQNFNNLPYLLVGTHPGYPLKRSLMKFQDVPSECALPLQATLHIFFVYAHKASFMTAAQFPSFPRYIAAHTVLKSWSESQATSTKRNSFSNWNQQWLNLGTDAGKVSLSSTKVQPTPGQTWYTLDVTQQAQDWKFGSNHGLLLRDTHEVLEGRDFRFASNAYADASKHAYITLKCAIKQQSSGGRGGGAPIGEGVNPL